MAQNVAQAIKTGVDALSGVELSNPRLDVEVLLAHTLGLAREDLFVRFDQLLTPHQQSLFDKLLTRRNASEPVARILGVKEFWSLEFVVNEATLIPRPDSETLVEAVVKQARELTKSELSVLDLGTGSGCLLLSVLSELKEARGVGVDAVAKAVDTAMLNANNLELNKRASFAQFNWLLDDTKSFNGQLFDIIISNPPYIESSTVLTLDKEVVDFDPRLSLDGGEDGLLHYKKLAELTKSLLENNGYLFLEIGIGQAKDICEIYKNEGWRLVETHKDLAQIERVLVFNQK